LRKEQKKEEKKEKREVRNEEVKETSSQEEDFLDIESVNHCPASGLQNIRTCHRSLDRS